MSDANLNDANFSRADLRAADLTRANWDNVVVEQAKLGGNRGLSRAGRQELHEKGAIFLSTLDESPADVFAEDNASDPMPHHVLERFGSDVDFRLLDVKEAVDLFGETLHLFTAAAEAQTGSDVLYQTYEALIEQLRISLANMEQNLREYHDELPHRNDRNALEASWDASELSGEFNRIHEQVLLVGKHIRIIHDAWKALDEQKSAPCYRSEQTTS